MLDMPALLNECTSTVIIEIEIDGDKVSANPGGLVSMSIEKEVNKIPTARIVFSESYEECKVKKIDADAFKAGKTIKIKAGYKTASELLFKGIIIKRSVQYRTNKPSVFEIECKDDCIRMAINLDSKNYLGDENGQKISDATIVERIIKRYEGINILKGGIPVKSIKHESVTKNATTDWDFLGLRAQANNYLVKVDDGTYSWIEIKLPVKNSFHATMGVNIIELETDEDAKKSAVDIQVNYWDQAQQQLKKETATSEKGDDEFSFKKILNIDLGEVVNPEAAKEAVETQKAYLELSRIRGRVKIKGTDIAQGEKLKISGVGGKIDGFHFISGVLHDFQKGSWTTNIQFGLPRKDFSQSVSSDSNSKPAPTHATVNGLYIGIVTQHEKDPVAGSNRVRVKIPQISISAEGEDKGIWARLGTLQAGDQRGFNFRPEINDEVIIGFLQNNPNNPIILGSLHSSKNQSPYPSKDTNSIKGYKSKGEMELTFDDDKKSIEIKTKKGYRLLIKDDQIEMADENSNSISLSQDGIEIKSDKKIVLNAGAGTVNIDGSQINLG